MPRRNRRAVESPPATPHLDDTGRLQVRRRTPSRRVLHAARATEAALAQWAGIGPAMS